MLHQTGLKLELPNANNNTKVCSFKSNEHIRKKVDGTRLCSILVSTDKFKTVNKWKKKKKKNDHHIGYKASNLLDFMRVLK